MVLLAINFDNLHQILQNLYTDMMPLCSQMTGVAKGLAGLGALFYVAYRVWQSLARAEPVDVFPLLRPFALGLCIMFFPTIVLGTLNSVMSPIVKGTHSILEAQTFDMNEYRAQKDRLSILGPISFALSCWDGFQASLSQWFVRYISIYLWLPVSDLFSSVLARIQVLMLRQDIEQLSDPNFIPDGSNGVYITFLIIGIIGYFTIPTVANWIIQAGGGAGNYGKNVTQTASKTGSVVAGAGGAAVGNIAGRLIK